LHTETLALRANSLAKHKLSWEWEEEFSQTHSVKWHNSGWGTQHYNGLVPHKAMLSI